MIEFENSSIWVGCHFEVMLEFGQVKGQAYKVTIETQAGYC